MYIFRILGFSSRPQKVQENHVADGPSINGHGSNFDSTTSFSRSREKLTQPQPASSESISSLPSSSSSTLVEQELYGRRRFALSNPNNGSARVLEKTQAASLFPQPPNQAHKRNISNLSLPIIPPSGSLKLKQAGKPRGRTHTALINRRNALKPPPTAPLPTSKSPFENWIKLPNSDCPSNRSALHPLRRPGSGSSPGIGDGGSQICHISHRTSLAESSERIQPISLTNSTPNLILDEDSDGCWEMLCSTPTIPNSQGVLGLADRPVSICRLQPKKLEESSKTYFSDKSLLPRPSGIRPTPGLPDKSPRGIASHRLRKIASEMLLSSKSADSRDIIIPRCSVDEGLRSPEPWYPQLTSPCSSGLQISPAWNLEHHLSVRAETRYDSKSCFGEKPQNFQPGNASRRLLSPGRCNQDLTIHQSSMPLSPRSFDPGYSDHYSPSGSMTPHWLNDGSSIPVILKPANSTHSSQVLPSGIFPAERRHLPETEASQNQISSSSAKMPYLNSSESSQSSSLQRSMVPEDSHNPRDCTKRRSHSLTYSSIRSGVISACTALSSDGRGPSIQLDDSGSELTGEAEMEVLSPHQQEMLAIMATHGECIFQPPVNIALGAQKHFERTLSSPQRSRPSSTVSSVPSQDKTPRSTDRLAQSPRHQCHGRSSSLKSNASDWYEDTPIKQSPPPMVRRSAKPRPEGSAVSLYRTISTPKTHQRLKNVSLPIRPSTAKAASPFQAKGLARKLSQSSRMNHTGRNGAHQEIWDPCFSKEQKFKALLRASDECSGGTMKLSLSSKIDSIHSDSKISPYILPPLNLRRSSACSSDPANESEEIGIL